ncbi:unnamed protein product [Withania somnifera]
MKWLWRYTIEDQALWKSVIREKYGDEDAWKTRTANTAYGVSVWKAFRNLWKIFSVNISYKIENGQKISFWEGNWLGNGHLKQLYLKFLF